MPTRATAGDAVDYLLLTPESRRLQGSDAGPTMMRCLRVLLALYPLCRAARRGAAIQSRYGTRLAQAFCIDPEDADTNAVIHGGVAFFKSDAVLTVLSHLRSLRFTRMLFAVPKPWRERAYNLFARNRCRIFGKYDACFVPDAAVRARLLE